MSRLAPYSSPQAVEKSIAAAAHKAHARDKSLTVSERIRLEYFNRFLTRVFGSDQGSQWVLKGGTAMLARLGSARSTTDIDLLRESDARDTALDELRNLAEIDLGDFFSFVLTGHSDITGTQQQTYTEGYQAHFDIYIGGNKKGQLSVDLVVNVTVTDHVDVLYAAHALDLPRLPDSPYRLYPVVDQIADKVCATVALYDGRPSSREKDLVDLVALAKTQTVSGDSLKRALAVEASVRNLDLPTAFTVPDAWGRRYSKLARHVTACSAHQDVVAAMELMSIFIDPPLRGETAGLTWYPQHAKWAPSTAL